MPACIFVYFPFAQKFAELPPGNRDLLSLSRTILDEPPLREKVQLIPKTGTGFVLKRHGDRAANRFSVVWPFCSDSGERAALLAKRTSPESGVPGSALLLITLSCRASLIAMVPQSLEAQSQRAPLAQAKYPHQGQPAPGVPLRSRHQSLTAWAGNRHSRPTSRWKEHAKHTLYTGWQAENRRMVSS